MKYNKGFAPLVVLLIIVGVLAVGGVAYFAGKSSAPKTEVADNSNYFPTTEQNYTPPTTNNNPPQQQTPPPSNNPPQQQQTPPPQQPPQPNTINSFFVVNADSGINVSNPTFTVNSNTYSSINTFLAYMQTLSSGLYNVNISAPGYQNMVGARISVPGNLSSMVINLDPITHAHNCPHSPSSASAFALCGYLADQNHNALAGVQVSSPTFSSISAVTASDGYYDTQFSPLQNYDCGNPVTFTYSKSGYKTLNYILNGPYIYMGGDMGTQLLMTHGSGTEQKTDKHGMCP